MKIVNAWARHGNTRWLWKDEDVRHAFQYVIDERGEPMALFFAKESFDADTLLRLAYYR